MTDSEYKVFYKDLGRKIDQIRKEKALSFRDLAIRCDVEKPNLVRLTKEGTNITVKTLYKISKGLEVPLSEIFRDL